VKKTWAEKLADRKNFPKVVKLEKTFPCYNAVEEAARAGKKLNIPYWRTLKADGYLNEKYPGGQEGHKKLLEKEGHKLISRGKRLQVADFEERLAADSIC